MIKILFSILIIVLLAISVLIIGPYNRSLKYTEIAVIETHFEMYDCAGEHCIGFVVDKINPEKYSPYQNKTLLPYRANQSRDFLQNELVALMDKTATVCIQGYLHKHTVNYLRLIHPAQGSYKFLLESVFSGSCPQ